MAKDMRVAGADVCQAGWVVAMTTVTAGRVSSPSFRIAATFAELMSEDLDRIAIDIPIGLLDNPRPGGREADRQARHLLGPLRGTSVFPAPSRRVLQEPTAPPPMPPGLGLTLQAWAILPKVAEVDRAVVGHQFGVPSATRPLVMETHPEVVFAHLASKPVEISKRTTAGFSIRQRLLEEAAGWRYPDHALRGADPDDVLDALACLWVASGPESELIRLPESPEVDSRGLRMEIWRRAVSNDLRLRIAAQAS